MKVDIAFPFRVHGTMVGRRSERLICASYVHAYELMAVDPAETSVILGATSAYDSTELGDMQYRTGPIGEVRSRRFELRRWNGRLFSRFCGVSELSERCGMNGDRRYCDHGLVHDTISMAGHSTPHMRLFEFMDQHINNSDLLHGRLRRRDARDVRFWVGDDEEQNLDRPPFHEWCSELKSFDADDMDDMLRHYRAIADRLVLIGQDVWIEVRNPCIAVATMSRKMTVTKEGFDGPFEYEEAGSVTYVYHGVLPDIVSNTVSRRWFNLDQGDEALEYARRWSSSGSKVVDLRLPIECEPKDVAFDAIGERLWHVGYALAIHCHDASRNIPRKFTDRERLVIADAYKEACKTNCVLRTRGTPEAYILTLMQLSERTSLRKSLMQLSERTSLRKSLMTMGIPQEAWRRSHLHNEVLDLLDNREIDIYRLG